MLQRMPPKIEMQRKLERFMSQSWFVKKYWTKYLEENKEIKRYWREL